jgi:hypothetical protein
MLAQNKKDMEAPKIQNRAQAPFAHAHAASHFPWSSIFPHPFPLRASMQFLAPLQQNIKKSSQFHKI